jgi:hypothetical protein
LAQVGVLSLSQLQLHDHYNLNSGGPVNTLSRVASATVKINHAAAVNTSYAAWVMMKRVLILEDSPGTMDINYTLLNTLGAGSVNAQARIYRAGVLIWSGVDNAEVAGPTIFTDPAIAVDLLSGDCIEIWGYKTGATACRVTAMEICYSGYITALCRRTLNAALLLTVASDILYEVVV